MPSAPPITAEQLLGITGTNHNFELIEGRLVVMEPAGYWHGLVAMNVAKFLLLWIAERELGDCLAAETGFVLQRGPDTVRAPDFAFVRKEHTPERRTGGYLECAPDFAAEVISQHDTPKDVHAKARHWISAGVGEVWVLDPKKRILTVYLPDREPADLTDGDEVRTTGLLTGFSCPVAELFGR